MLTVAWPTADANPGDEQDSAQRPDSGDQQPEARTGSGRDPLPARPWDLDGDNSILKSKSEARDAQSEICADFTHHRHRLQHRRSPLSADEGFCTHARAKGDFPAHTDVMPGERPPSMPPRSCQNVPGHDAPGGKPHVEAESSDSPGIVFNWVTLAFRHIFTANPPT